MAGVTRALHCGSYALPLERPLVMGIVNVTPDSFSDGGRHADAPAAVAHARTLLDEGADLIDIGGESTRPGAPAVTLEEERRRVLPVIEALAGCGVPVSVDTRKPQLMKEALAAGASMVNDVNALRAPGALEAVAATRASVCLMHMRGDPATMQDHPLYDDVVAEVRAFLQARIEAAEHAGIERSRIIIDPGFGFAKTREHGFELLNNLHLLKITGKPILAGLSRKSMIWKTLNITPDDALNGTSSLNTIALMNGASILRVHDVKAAHEVVTLFQAVKKNGVSG